MKFLIDMPPTPDLVPWLQSQGHDAVHALSTGLAMSADEAILARGREEGRIVVTADLDYPRILALTHVHGPAVILFRGGNYSDAQMLELLKRVLNTSTDADLKNSITVVDRSRIRRTRLPLVWRGGTQATQPDS